MTNKKKQKQHHRKKTKHRRVEKSLADKQQQAEPSQPPPPLRPGSPTVPPHSGFQPSPIYNESPVRLSQDSAYTFELESPYRAGTPTGGYSEFLSEPASLLEQQIANCEQQRANQRKLQNQQGAIREQIRQLLNIPEPLTETLTASLLAPLPTQLQQEILQIEDLQKKLQVRERELPTIQLHLQITQLQQEIMRQQPEIMHHLEDEIIQQGIEDETLDEIEQLLPPQGIQQEEILQQGIPDSPILGAAQQPPSPGSSVSSTSTVNTVNAEEFPMPPGQ